MEKIKKAFQDIGWFIPPYCTMAYISKIYKEVTIKKNFSQKDLELFLSHLYSHDHLASMLKNRYPLVPYVREYQLIINESIEAHFLGLNYVSVTGLMPIIEGIVTKLVDYFEIQLKVNKNRYGQYIIIDAIEKLIEHCINKEVGNKIEVNAMMSSFRHFIKNYLFVQSNSYKLEDHTNRHGLLHGVFTDKDYGNPISFYKTLSVLNFLCFIISFKESISWFAPEETIESKKLSVYFRLLENIKTK